MGSKCYLHIPRHLLVIEWKIPLKEVWETLCYMDIPRHLLRKTLCYMDIPRHLLGQFNAIWIFPDIFFA